MAFKALSGVVACAAALLMAGQALAQAQDNYFSRDRNISVRERARPGYDALGMPLSGFIAYPKIELGVQENTNIYGAAANPTADTVGIISPEINLASRWSRNSLTFFARTQTRAYASHSGEDTTDWQTGGTGRLDLGASTISFQGDYGYLAEPRTAVISQTSTSFATLHPIEYYLGETDLDARHTFNRLQIEGEASYKSYQFQNGTNAADQLVLESPLDYDRMVASAKAGYAVSPDTAIYASFRYNTISYPNNSATVTTNGASRNSSGESYDVGANFDLTQLIRGDAQFGYLHQQFDSPLFKPLDGFHALAKVEWFPTELATVTVSGERDVNAATLPGSASMISGVASGQVDYELLRNVILTGIARYQDDAFQGVDRDDHIVDVAISADYLLNRGVGVHLAYDYLTQDSYGVNRGVTFNDNRVTLSTTLQY